MKQPLVYITILNWNGFDETVECLKSFKNLSYPNYKIVLIDNGSKQDEGEKLKQQFPRIKLIKNKKNTGFGFAHNQGMQEALKNNADYVLTLNNDVTFRDDFLGKLVSFMEEDTEVGICGPVIRYEGTDKVWFGGSRTNFFGLPRQEWKGRSYKEYLKNVSKPKEIFFMTGCASLIRATLLKKIGLFDPIYFAYVEDVDLCHRCKNAGYKVMIVPSALIDHKKSASAAAELAGTKKFSAFQTYLIGRNEIIFGRKNLQGYRKLLYFLGVLTIKFAFFMLYGADMMARWKYLVGLIRGFTVGLNTHFDRYPD